MNQRWRVGTAGCTCSPQPQPSYAAVTNSPGITGAPSSQGSRYAGTVPLQLCSHSVLSPASFQEKGGRSRAVQGCREKPARGNTHWSSSFCPYWPAHVSCTERSQLAREMSRGGGGPPTQAGMMVIKVQITTTPRMASPSPHQRGAARTHLPRASPSALPKPPALQSEGFQPRNPGVVCGDVPPPDCGPGFLHSAPGCHQPHRDPHASKTPEKLSQEKSHCPGDGPPSFWGFQERAD